MQLRAVISDFDGTIADSNLLISHVDLEAITLLTKFNIPFSIATGRPYVGTIKHYVNKLKLTAPQITSGGACIVDPTTHQIISATFLSKEAADIVIKYSIFKNISFVAENFLEMFTVDGIPQQAYGSEIIFRNIEQLDLDQTIKISLYVNTFKQACAVVEHLKNITKNSLHIVQAKTSTKQFSIDVTNIEASKYHAALKLSDHIEIPLDNIMGIGDSGNDVPLLKACGIKVSVGNSHSELNSIAHHIVPPQKQGGFAIAINQLVR